MPHSTCTNTSTTVNVHNLLNRGLPIIFLDFSQPTDTLITWEGQLRIEKAGCVNALRFVTKNILAVVPEENSTIDWLNHYMSLPVANPLQVKAGDVLQIALQYRAGCSIPTLEAAIRMAVVTDKVDAGRAVAHA